DPRFGLLPIIAMTAHAMSGDRDRCLAAGMNDHVAKPIVVTELLDVLTRWLAAGTGVAATVAGPAAVSFDGLSQVLDIKGALARLEGNAALLDRLLIGFAEQFAETGAALPELDPEALERMAHTLTGLAGTIGAQRLAAAARAVEIALREGRSPDV
ncbi:MAG: Hpt domain-containing protein, partial [Alphaproteobacteria bacterium]|nr:Hpt domain-containing protein [Alphaproteobacteria bacterium]